jgi:membrane-associated protease RseP (regulator of RpoE activity)
VICDGDIRVGENMIKNLIIARGNISVEGWGYLNTLIVGGTVTFKKPLPLEPGQKLPKDRESAIEEHVRKPLGYITFFELSTVGVEVKVADTAVSVAKVAEGKPFAKAGVKVGDVVAEVNGKKPDSAESLRRLLRDALALGDVTLKRGEKTETVKVSLPE